MCAYNQFMSNPNRASDAGPEDKPCRCGGNPVAQCETCGRSLCESHALTNGDDAYCARCKAIQIDEAEENAAEELTLS